MAFSEERRQSKVFLIPTKIYDELPVRVRQYMKANDIKDTDSKYTLYLSKIEYIIHKIGEQQAMNYSDPYRGFVPLNFDTLGKNIGQRYVDPILKAVQAWGWVTCDNDYTSTWVSNQLRAIGIHKEVKSKGYKISPEYKSVVVSTFVMNETLEAKLIRLKSEYRGRFSTTQYLYQQLKHVGIHGDAARADAKAKYERSVTLLNSFSTNHYKNYLNALSEASEGIYGIDEGKHFMNADNTRRKPCYDDVYSSIEDAYNHDLTSIAHIEEENYYLIQDETSQRVHTPITSASSVIEKNLFYKKDPDHSLYSIDLRNSQLFFLSLYLTKHFQGKDIPLDVQEFNISTAKGQFYELMLDLLEVSHSQRKRFKKKLFGKVVYCKTSTTERSREGKAFAKRFPTVATLIAEVKRDDYKRLSFLMQSEEVEAIINKVVAKVQAQGLFVATKHDSCIVLEKDVTSVLTIMENVFATEYGLVPTLSCEPLAKDEPSSKQSLKQPTQVKMTETVVVDTGVTHQEEVKKEDAEFEAWLSTLAFDVNDDDDLSLYGLY